MAWNNNGIHDVAEVWLVPYFMKKYVAAVPTDFLSMTSIHQQKNTKEGVLNSYKKVMNFLLQKYARYDIMEQTGNDKIRCTQPPGASLSKLARKMWMKKSHFPQVYNKCVLEATFFAWPPTLDLP